MGPVNRFWDRDRKGMVQGTLETARKNRPLGSDSPLWTMPKPDRTPGDKKLHR
jgi:hypothetical protein